MNKQEADVGNKCLECGCYWQNTDTENECEGAKEACHEFIKIKHAEEGAVKDE